LRLVESEKFDFLLTDIRMPEMDGIALARKSLELDPELGVILAPLCDVDTAKKAIVAGAYDYVMKPFELPEIRHSSRPHPETAGTSGKRGPRVVATVKLDQRFYTVGDCRSLLKRFSALRSSSGSEKDR
jgi:DNA-binding NtrC family response regulator